VKKEDWEADCKVISDCLFKYGCLVIKDPVRLAFCCLLSAVCLELTPPNLCVFCVHQQRVDHKQNDVFIDQMEKYYEQPKAVKVSGAWHACLYVVFEVTHVFF
jgi:hypothetical protein